MRDTQPQFIEVSRLQVGMYIYLDLGWTEHPFPWNSFKICSKEQIDIIRKLGLERVRYSPEKSEAAYLFQPAEKASGMDTAAPGADAEEVATVAPEMEAKRKRRLLLEQQQASLRLCERKFNDASRGYKRVLKSVHASPQAARAESEGMVRGFLDEILGDQEAAIRLLSENIGEETSSHSINVTVISLLLGKACGLSDQEMMDLGLGALLHDMGKVDLPDRLRWYDDFFSTAERQLFQQHVAYGVELAKRMELPGAAALVVGQHHENADGSGYPLRLMGERMSPAAKIVSLVNQYDNLCNPANPAQAMTPHEALSHMFAQWRNHYDSATLAQFIRMMGVYPPGSVVQLTDERFALVVSVNSSRPLKPRVLIHDPYVPKDDAIVVDLENLPEIGVRRSMKPLQLPRPVFDYLSPRKRMCYFFERAREVSLPGEEP